MSGDKYSDLLLVKNGIDVVLIILPGAWSILGTICWFYLFEPPSERKVGPNETKMP